MSKLYHNLSVSFQNVSCADGRAPFERRDLILDVFYDNPWEL
jgi:hypothetical protein